MASTHSDDEATEDKPKPDDMAVDSSAAAKDTRNSESQEKRTENTSNLQASSETEEKDDEKTVESKIQAKENHINVEMIDKAVDTSNDRISTSKNALDNKVKK